MRGKTVLSEYNRGHDSLRSSQKLEDLDKSMFLCQFLPEKHVYLENLLHLETLNKNLIIIMIPDKQFLTS
jgi:hypothetical protein